MSKPDARFPDGVDLDLRKSDQIRDWCYLKLPYPTGRKNIGSWLVECKRCGLVVKITAASRPDDPRSVMLPCKEAAS